jgi:hypothetical protein
MSLRSSAIGGEVINGTNTLVKRTATLDGAATCLIQRLWRYFSRSVTFCLQRGRDPCGRPFRSGRRGCGPGRLRGPQSADDVSEANRFAVGFAQDPGCAAAAVPLPASAKRGNCAPRRGSPAGRPRGPVRARVPDKGGNIPAHRRCSAKTRRRFGPPRGSVRRCGRYPRAAWRPGDRPREIFVTSVHACGEAASARRRSGPFGRRQSPAVPPPAREAAKGARGIGAQPHAGVRNSAVVRIRGIGNRGRGAPQSRTDAPPAGPGPAPARAVNYAVNNDLPICHEGQRHGPPRANRTPALAATVHRA